MDPSQPTDGGPSRSSDSTAGRWLLAALLAAAVTAQLIALARSDDPDTAAPAPVAASGSGHAPVAMVAPESTVKTVVEKAKAEMVAVQKNWAADETAGGVRPDAAH